MAEAEKKTVLVVDDEPDIRELLSMEFQMAGWNVFEAETGVEALKTIASKKIDCVVSDIRMPGSDGVDLLGKIREQDPLNPAVILITGHAGMNLPEAFHSGAEAVLVKPFALQDLVQAVRRAMTPLEGRWKVFEDVDFQRPVSRSIPRLTNEYVHGILRIGRGGISFSSGLLTLRRGNKVDFDFQEEGFDRPLRIRGRGSVSWIQKDSRRTDVWIEFEELSETTKNDVLDLVRRERSKSYIPFPS